MFWWGSRIWSGSHRGSSRRGHHADAQRASMRGLGGDQNGTLSDGLAFIDAKLTRDTRVQTHTASSPLDPSMGGLGATRAVVERRRGNVLNQAQSHISFDALFAQASDPVARPAGERSLRIRELYLRWCGTLAPCACNKKATSRRFQKFALSQRGLCPSLC
jgi:hypothetical protein